MPRFLEERLEAQAAKEGKTGRAADRYVYGAMNNMGAMHGNKETAKGRAMERKHQKDLGAPPVQGLKAEAKAEGESPEYEAGEHSFMRHGRMVKEAHDHLSKVMPAYRTLSKRQRGLALQEHIRARRGL